MPLDPLGDFLGQLAGGNWPTVDLRGDLCTHLLIGVPLTANVPHIPA